jgi:hypothetical protein
MRNGPSRGGSGWPSLVSAKRMTRSVNSESSSANAKTARYHSVVSTTTVIVTVSRIPAMPESSRSARLERFYLGEGRVEEGS